VGLFSIFCGLLLVLSLMTFDSRDPWLNHTVSGVPQIRNRAGLFGAYVSGFLFDVLGLAAWVVPAFFGLAGARSILNSSLWDWWRWAGFLLLAVCIAWAGTAREHAVAGQDVLARHGGGLLGRLVHSGLESWLGATGATLLWIFALVLGIQMLVGFSWFFLAASGAGTLWRWIVPLLTAWGRFDRKKKARPTAEGKDGAAPSCQPENGLILLGDTTCPLPPVPPYSSLPVSGKTAADQDVDFPPWLEDFEADSLTTAGKAVDKHAVFSISGSGEMPEQIFPAPCPSQAGEACGRPPGSPGGTARAGEEEAGQTDGTDKIQVQVRAGGVVEPSVASSGLLRQVVEGIRHPFRAPLPDVELLGPVPAHSGSAPRSALEAKGGALMACLADFGIQGELVGITPGPVVTMFEVRPAPGVRVARISGLSDDLSLALKAVAVRIQAPVPGTDTVGIEIPNELRETVFLRELIGSRVFQEAKSPLTLALGKDIAGGPAVADLGSMPHLLVAGTTGSGKSVGINSIILSLLYKARPEEVKLLLVDPKRVEMAVYAGLPHLVHPVVTEMSLAKNALEWAVKEMERRYEDLARIGVRNIADYNLKLASFGGNAPEGLEDLRPIPYLVIIIDELADLMLVASKEVETSVVRLAQLARAAGIHLILATQRPSVDVVTGLIKANFACRIAFQVTSRHDSRTILDTVGAEYLLGRGDMLFKPGGGKSRRLHGAFVSEEAVQTVAEYWRSRQQPEYLVDFADWSPPEGEGEAGSMAGSGGDISSDPLYAEVIAFVRQQGKASVSLVQRRFRIGFNKAARFMEQMEKDGIVSPADGSKPRQVH
jgi:S-DNA-T family DNA segregation ATPase FtsK/SpoIIIE